MSQPVNLDNLRDMTGGDSALEKELFVVFLNSSEDCLVALKTSCGAGAEETWRTQAHAWKGMCLNLGAETLGQLCAKAQQSPEAPEEEKTTLLSEIIKEYNAVRSYLKEIYPDIME